MAVDFKLHPAIAPSKSAYLASMAVFAASLGLDFGQHPELANHPDRPWETWYAHDYLLAEHKINNHPKETREPYSKGVMRELIKHDLFFIIAFVMEVPIDICNKPYVVQSCNDLEASSPDGGLSATDILDIESREHFKSTVRTLALTIKRIVNNPDCCTAIFSFKKDAANAFVRSIKETFERPFIIWAFPEIFYADPNNGSPSWSVQNGICVKRKSASRRENTVQGFGLIEGMPIGGHFEHRMYDDIETWDISKSVDQMNICFSSFEMSFSIGKEGGTELIHGTYYHHNGPLARIRDKVKAGVISADGKPVPLYRTIIKSATHDGTKSGRPVLFSPEYLQKCIDKAGKHFDSQYLCNPSPVDDVLLDKSALKPISPEALRVGHWKDRFKFMVIDQAGDKDTNLTKSKGDMWSIGVVSIVPASMGSDDDMGISDVCLEELICDQMTHSQAIDCIVRMYLRHLIMQLGVEKVGLSTTEIHVVDALAPKGRKLSVAHGNLFLLRPAGRSTEDRVSGALQWPLNNGHLWYSTAIDQEYLQKLMMEMDQFGFNHPDALNMLAYSYDMFKEFPFARYAKRKVQSVTAMLAAGGPLHGEWGA